jgi:rod shape-determining protein MreC
MASASERSYSRRDTVLFVACLGLSLVALFSPASWGYGVSDALRNSVLAPLVWLQARAEEGRTSRARLKAVTVQRDSAAYLAQGIPSLMAENERLRQLLALSRRISTPYVAAEVLHQAHATDGRTLLIDVGRSDLVSEFDPVVAPEGLIGMVLTAGERSSVVMTWAHPEFRVSAYTVSGNANGVVAPSLSSLSGEGALEFRGVPYRDSVPTGTLVLSSGLGGVYPKGIPVGTVTRVVREQAGWERVYRLLPAANPAGVAHVLVLVSPPGASMERAFPSDSALLAMRLDSIARVREADSIAAAKVAAKEAAEKAAAEKAAAEKAAAQKAAAQKAAAQKAAAQRAAAQKAAAERTAAPSAVPPVAPPAAQPTAPAKPAPAPAAPADSAP